MNLKSLNRKEVKKQMNAIGGLTLALIIVSVLALFLFVWAFEKMGDNKRNMEYFAKGMGRTDDRAFESDQRLAKLYAKDNHGFERPKVDLVEDRLNSFMGDQFDGASTLIDRVEDLEEKIKEVKT